MKQYNRIMLGRGGMYVEECVRDGYIGVDFNIYEICRITGKLERV